ncbi:MAG TPA: hypothetical protein VGD65_13430 [Chryseosolibacter sp.]
MLSLQAENTFPNPLFRSVSDRPVININPVYGRLYFSTFAVNALNLDKSAFVIGKRGARWVINKTTNLPHFVLKKHQGAYYIVSKPLVFKLADEFQHHRPSFLIEGLERKRKYYTLKFFPPDPATIRPSRAPKLNQEEREKLAKLTPKERIIYNYEKTNFAGRVKTQETQRVQEIVSRSYKI